MNYLTSQQIVLIHDALIKQTGGVYGVRDRHLLSSLEHSPRQSVFGKELYPTIPAKAAVYARDIALNHPFIDGNKRTAMVATDVFLENNNYKLEIAKGELEKFALQIITEKLTIESIGLWLEKNSSKIDTYE